MWMGAHMDKHHTARDSHEAYIWFRTAAEQGNPYAQFNWA
jgi:TPR repeat protein